MTLPCHNRTKTLLCLLSAVLVTVTSPSFGRDSNTSISTGYVYGDREDNLGLDTTVEIVPLSISYKMPELKIKLSTAYVRLTGPGDIFLERNEDDSIDIYVETDRERSGMGDSFLTLTYSPKFLKSRNKKLSLGYKYKSPTGDETKGLSSGEEDHHVFLRGFYRIQRVLLLGRLGYQFMGDTEEYDYNNRAYVGLGLLYIAHRNFSFGTQYYTKESSLDTREDIKSASLVFQYRPTKHWSAALNLVKGLSDSSLDKQAGLQVSYRF